MREILFKGKRLDDGEWVEGFYWTNGLGNHFIRVNQEPFSVYGDYEFVLKDYDVDPETVCQYTGLTDCDGKRIFEGDVVRLWDVHNGFDWHAVVEFGNPNCEYNWGWQLRYINGDCGNCDILLWVDMDEYGAHCEISGNIFDNPELLKVEG